LTFDAIALAVENLRQQFTRQVSDNTFPSFRGMRELADLAAFCRNSPLKSRVLVAFTLEKTLSDWADDLHDRSVSTAEAELLRGRIHAPVNRAIEFLCNGSEDDPIEVCCKLVSVAR
jgi:hypothetical protein